MLTGYLALLCIVSNLLYILIHLQTNTVEVISLNVFFCATSAATILFMRASRFDAAKFSLFLGAFGVIYFFCLIEPRETAVGYFLLLVGIGATALFGMDKWKYAIGLSVLASFMFGSVYILNWHIDFIQFSELYVNKNFILNFFVFQVMSMLILYFMLELNKHAEKSLERKEAETQQRNLELTKLNAELDRFVYSVSHDLRSPMATINGLVYLGKNAQSVGEAQEYFVMIGERVKTQEFFIREIIDFYRNSRTEVKPEAIVLKQHVDEIIAEQEVVNQHIRFDVQIDPTLTIWVDKIRLRSVLSNLIGNAIKYHDSQKPEPFVAVTADYQNASLLIGIQDNGIGIAETHHARIFEMFYRASPDSKGSGLGLFIARETVEKLGGKIAVESTFGIGSRFSVTLPGTQALHN